MSSAPVDPGDVLAGKYRVDAVLGAGGMGVVVRATHLALGQPVALKFLLPHASLNAEVMGRFLREAQLAVRLKSEHVARVLDVGQLETGAPYIVMEYLEGEDLNQRLKRTGPLPVAEVAEYVIQACDGIAEAHALGIVHRDLKPANLFLTRRADGAPLVKVLDFGISKVSALDEQAGALTTTGQMIGSPYYMSPEQMRSARDADARSDVWSLGVIVYQLLTARLPFPADTLGGLMAMVLSERPEALTVGYPDAPPALSQIILRCLEKDRDRRASNVAELALALAPFAPARAQPIAERVAALLGVHTAPLAVSTAMAVSRVAPVPKKGAPVAAIAVGAAVLLGGGLLVARQLLAPGREAAPPAVSAGAASATEGPAPAPMPPSAAPAAPATAETAAAPAPSAAPTAGPPVGAPPPPSKKAAPAAPSARASAAPAAKKSVLDDRN